MNPQLVIVIRSTTVGPPAPDRLTRWLVILIALGLAWQALRPHVSPQPAEASRETVAIDIARVGGRLLTDGRLPVKCSR